MVLRATVKGAEDIIFDNGNVILPCDIYDLSKSKFETRMKFRQWRTGLLAQERQPGRP